MVRGDWGPEGGGGGREGGSTQKKLVKVKNLSLETAIETAKIDETASRDTNELQHRHGEASVSVLKLHSQQQPRQNRERERDREPRRNYICYRCNGRGHRSDVCRFRDEICHGCGKPGHIRAVCRFGDKNKRYKKSKKVNQMSAAKGDSSNGSDDNEWSDGLHTLDAVHQLTKPKNRTDIIWTTLRVAGQPLKMEVDTVSAYSAIPHHVYKEMFQKQELQPTSVTLRTYMGSWLSPKESFVSRSSTRSRR